MKRRAFARKRGFTLVELMISLSMGVIIALATVALSRTATTTFFEQARISGVEANVRAASERFRNDLSRVAYMSTPNIHRDPKVARIPGTLGSPYRIAALQDLQGIRVAPADSAIRGHDYSTRNSITPHEVHIAGNLTSDDVYRGQYTASGVGCGGGGGAEILLNASADPAVRRLFNGATSANERKTMTEAVFMPGERMVPAQSGFQYAVQVMDMRGCFHYMTICGVVESAQPDAVVLHLAGTPTQGLLTTEETGGDVCGARVMEEVAIAPVQRVRWSLAVENDPRRIDTALDGVNALNKFNLYRQVLAADGSTAIGSPELIAEYAVDLKLGLLVDSAIPGSPPSMTNIDFEGLDTEFSKWAGPANESAENEGPQRIRSVRYRLAFRTAFPDRRADLPMPSGPPYISRYCMGPDPCVDWARVRTVISEVALLNQSKANY